MVNLKQIQGNDNVYFSHYYIVITLARIISGEFLSALVLKVDLYPKRASA
jgi:hypothetical protein